MRITASAPATAPAIKPVLLLPSLPDLLGCVTSGSVDVVVVDEVIFGVGVATVVLAEVGVESTAIEDVVVGFGSGGVVVGFGFGFGGGGGGGGICGARL